MTTIDGFIFAYQSEYSNTPHFIFREEKTFGTWAKVGPATVSFEVPTTFNMTAEQIKILENERRKAGKEYAKTVASINERLAKLQCLTNEVEA